MDEIKVTEKQLREMVENDVDYSNVDVSGATNMSRLFADRGEVKFDITKWDVSNVRDMSYMFSCC